MVPEYVKAPITVNYYTEEHRNTMPERFDRRNYPERNRSSSSKATRISGTRRTLYQQPKLDEVELEYSAYERTRQSNPRQEQSPDSPEKTSSSGRSRSTYQQTRRSNPGTKEPSRNASRNRYQQRRPSDEDAESIRNSTRGRYHQIKAAPKKTITLPVLLAILLIVIVGFIAVYCAEIRIYTVSVNGVEHELRGRYSLARLVEEGYAHPLPGNLLAIDGTLLMKGAGEPFEAFVNGVVEPNHDHILNEGETIVIADGQDSTEAIEERTEVIPYEIHEEGEGPIHVIEGEGVDGEYLVRAGSISGLEEQREEVKTPHHKVYRKYYPDVQGEKVVALTFDDGPWGETTEAILAILKEHDAKATFFTLGERIENPQGSALVKQAYKDGHQIASHSYSHARGSGNGVDLGLMPPEEQLQEIKLGYEAIEHATGTPPSPVIRAPGGNFNSETQKILDHLITAEIGWTIDTNDWRQPGVHAIADEIRSVRPGGIILMHDGGGNREQTVDALKEAIPSLKEAGYRFVTIDELLKYPPKS